MKLNEIKDNSGSTKSRKRIGRGIGSGTGKTSGKGHKGQKSRSGVSIKGFEGGQMPIHRRLPKRGFTNINRVNYTELNLGNIQKLIDSKKIDPKKIISYKTLLDLGLVKSKKVKKIEKSSLIGEILAKRAKEKNISEVYFDRGEYKYHGRVKIFAETLRKNGLNFWWEIVNI